MLKSDLIWANAEIWLKKC